VPREFLAHVAATVRRALTERTGDVLAFLPGVREVDDVVSRLRESPSSDVDILPLHGRLSAGAQDAALAPSPPGRRRVVVATNVAESSLTVPGVRVVVDATLTRRPHLDVAHGMSGLVTVGESRSAGIQRAGRAGREGPGAVYRCCSPVDWARAPQAPTPEILSADLTRVALELAVWGAPGGADLAWIDPPPAPAMEAAHRTLTHLGLLNGGAGASASPLSATALGRAVARIPTEVRLARALLIARGIMGAKRAAEATALLSTGLRPPGGDLTALARSVRDGGTHTGMWRAEARRLERAAERLGARDASLDAATATRRYTNPGMHQPGKELVQGMEVVITPDITVDPDEIIAAAVDAGLAYSEQLTRETSLVVCNQEGELRGKAMHARRKGIPLVSDTEFMQLTQNVRAGTAE